MFNISRILGCAALLATATTTLQAQSLGNSPYSAIGIGDINLQQGNIRNQSMGGAGLSAVHSSEINFINPALLYYNNLVTFELGITGQLKQIQTAEESQRDGSTTLNYLALSFPITKFWTSGVGLRPLSSVDYDQQTIAPLADDPTTQVATRYIGDGNLSEAFFSNGFKLYKGLLVGASASYVFGALTNETTVQLVDTAQTYLGERTLIGTRTSYNDFRFQVGLAYRQKVGETIHLNAGGTYTFGADLEAERERVQQRIQNNTNLLLDQEVIIQNSQQAAYLPHSFGVGLSLDNGKNWAVAADVNMQKLSEFRAFNQKDSYTDSYSIGVGGEYVPDPTSVESYFKRVTYRGGINFTQLPLEINGQQLTDISFNLGATMPMGRVTFTEKSFLNMAVAVGRRGTTEENLVQENYLRFSIGLSVNNRWFQKRRID